MSQGSRVSGQLLNQDFLHYVGSFGRSAQGAYTKQRAYLYLNSHESAHWPLLPCPWGGVRLGFRVGGLGDLVLSDPTESSLVLPEAPPRPITPARQGKPTTTRQVLSFSLLHITRAFDRPTWQSAGKTRPNPKPKTVIP